jgi:PAS domain S-box-containing protein
MRLHTLVSAKRTLLPAFLCIVLCACGLQSGKAGPSIEFTKVPHAGAGHPYHTATIAGRVTGARTGQKIVLYARSGVWWIQPRVDHPYTAIQANSTWSNLTHPGTRYAALLVGPNFHPPNITIMLPRTGGAVMAVAVVHGKPFFWETWWFRLSLALALLALVFAAYRVRVKSIEEREQQFRKLAENAPDIVMRFDSELHCSYVNPIIEEYTGLVPEALRGKTSQEVGLFEKTAHSWEASLRQAFSTGRATRKEFALNTPKGERGFEARIVPELGADGVAKSLLVVTRDITERKRAESLLAGEKWILEMVARGDALPQILDSLCRFVEEQATGVLASILLLDGNRLRHGGAPSLPKAYTDAIDGAMIGPSAGSCGTAAYRAEQVIVEDIATDPLWAEYCGLALPHSLRACWSTPVFSSEGKVIATFAMYYREPRTPSPRDHEIIEQITHLAGVAIQRRLTEEKLRRSEAYLAEGQRLTHMGSWSLNIAARQALHSSAEHTRLFGFDPEKGLPSFEEFLQRVHPEDQERVIETFQALMRSGEDLDLQYRIAVPGGPVRYLHAIGHPVLKQSGTPAEYVGITMDITERKRAERESQRLRQLEADLGHFNRVSMIGELAASLAHEVKQPIAAAVTNANACLRWLARTQPDLEEAREAASRIVKDATRAAEIITRTRSLYQKDAGQRELLDVTGVIREMIALLQNEAARYSISIRPELAEGVPEVMADRVQLQQVFMNLMLNGIEAMTETAGELTIRLQVDQEGQLLISVSDTGVGLPTEKADHIFDAFFTTKPQGTGMGLAISRSIVESHGGRLWATANGGRGATFCFTLPREMGVHA